MMVLLEDTHSYIIHTRGWNRVTWTWIIVDFVQIAQYSQERKNKELVWGRNVLSWEKEHIHLFQDGFPVVVIVSGSEQHITEEG